MTLLSLIPSFTVSSALLTPSAFAEEAVPKIGLLAPDGSATDVLNIQSLEDDKTVFIDTREMLRAVKEAKSWSLLVLDFESKEIVWSKEGAGRPPNKIEWNGQLEDGDYPAADQTLEMRLVVQTGKASVKSEVLKIQVLDDANLWRRIDRGLHMSPRGSIGVGRLSVTTSSGEDREFVLWPIVITDLNFHIDRRHHFGVRLESATRVVERGSGASLANAALHYRYSIFSGEGFGISFGGELFGAKIASIYGPKTENKDTVDTFYVAVVGGAAVLQGSYAFGGGFSLDLETAYGQGSGKYGGSLAMAEMGFAIPLTENISLRPVVGEVQYQSKVDDGGDDEADVSKRKDQRAVMDYLRLVVSMVI